jgi:hypothetical protein
VARGGSAALRVAPRALTVGNLTRAASRAGKAVRVTAATGLAGWRSLSGWQKTLVLIDIWDKSADNVLPHNRAERWATEQIGAALGALFAEGDDVAGGQKDATKRRKTAKDRRAEDRKRTEEDKDKGIHRGNMDDAHRRQRNGSVHELGDQDVGIKNVWPDNPRRKTRQRIKRALWDWDE